MKSKRGYLVILILSVILVIIISGYVQQTESVNSEEAVDEISQVAAGLPEESPPIEGEANNLTDIIPQNQNLTANQPAIQETKVQEPKCSREFSPQFKAEPYYNGPLFDAHFHMPNLIDVSKIGGYGEGQDADHGSDPITDPVLGRDVELGKILCNFEKEKVRGAIGFAIGAEQALDETLNIAKSIKEESSGKINLFLMPVMFSTGGLESIEKSNKGLFKGYGEMTFYDQDYANTPPDSPVVMETYKVAEKHNLIVMIHPGRNQKSNIENVLQKNPNVNFLLHGFEIENDIVDLMDKYPNVYFSIDSAVLYAMQGLFMGSKEQFVSRFEQEFDVNMNRAVNKWKSAVEKHPDRFMWGSDRGLPWHYDEDVSILFEEFGRAFIGKLDPSVQEKFAYENAEELIATVS